MTRRIVSRDHVHPRLSSESWDAFVASAGGSFLQSWEWGQFQDAAGHGVVRHVVAREGETKPVAAIQAFVHALPMGQTHVYVPRGPVMAQGAVPADAMVALDDAAEIARIEGSVFLRADLPFVIGEVPIAAEALREAGYRHRKSMQPGDTVIMELSKDEATLLSEMHQKTRYNVRLAERHGVTVRESVAADDGGFDDEKRRFWELLSETAERDKFHTHPRGYYDAMLDAFGPGLGKRLTVRLRFAEHEGKPISAVLLAEFGDTVTYLHGASSAAHRSMMAPYLLQWRAIVDARMRGFKKYDFWGIAPTDDGDHPWAGITRFKKGFGGEHVAYAGGWELPVRPFWYTLYRAARRLRG